MWIITRFFDYLAETGWQIHHKEWFKFRREFHKIKANYVEKFFVNT